MKVNKILYLLITFFLGSFGVHKFYAEKHFTGLIYLCLCWTFIPSVLALIEFVYVLICKKPDDDGNIRLD